MVVVMAGMIQVVVSLTKAGRIVKLVPVPVVAGFMTGSGVLMIRSQFEPVAIPGLASGTMTPSWIPAATALATILAMWQGGRRLPAVPAVIPGLLAGIGTFYTLCWWFDVAAPAAWVVGELPRLAWSELATRPAVQSHMPWLVIFVALGLIERNISPVARQSPGRSCTRPASPGARCTSCTAAASTCDFRPGNTTGAGSRASGRGCCSER